ASWIDTQRVRSSSRLRITPFTGRSSRQTCRTQRVTTCQSAGRATCGCIRVQAIPFRRRGKIMSGCSSVRTRASAKSSRRSSGAAIPSTYRLDGIDILPALSGRSPLVQRQLFWRKKGPAPQRAVRSGPWKLMQDGVNLYLFDVATDPGERHDVTADHLELVRKLVAMLDAWERDIDGRDRVSHSGSH